MLKRFRFGSQDSITNPNPNIIRLAKITNPNPNIRDLEKKIRIRIQIFVTTLLSSSKLYLWSSYLAAITLLQSFVMMFYVLSQPKSQTQKQKDKEKRYANFIKKV